MPVCARCGQDNPGGFRFCGACGAPLTAPAPERRKPATLVFCDLSGSTATGERLDAESVRELMSRYFAEMRAAIEAHGGTVEKFIGDAVVAIFGSPSPAGTTRCARSAPPRRCGSAPARSTTISSVATARRSRCVSA